MTVRVRDKSFAAKPTPQMALKVAGETIHDYRIV